MTDAIKSTQLFHYFNPNTYELPPPGIFTGGRVGKALLAFVKFLRDPFPWQPVPLASAAGAAFLSPRCCLSQLPVLSSLGPGAACLGSIFNLPASLALCQLILNFWKNLWDWHSRCSATLLIVCTRGAKQRIWETLPQGQSIFFCDGPQSCYVKNSPLLVQP